MSTLTLSSVQKITPAPLLVGCRVECTRGSIESALRQLKRVCERNGRKNVRNVARRDYPETRGQKCRRKAGEAAARRERKGKGRAHRDP